MSEKHIRLYLFNNTISMEEQIPQNKPKNQIPSPALWIVLGVVIFIIIAAFLYYSGFFDTNSNSNVNTNTPTNTTGNTNTQANTNTATDIDTSDWKTYENAKYGYSFKYPSDWTIVDNETINWFSGSEANNEMIIRPKNSGELTLDYQNGCFVAAYEITDQSISDFITNSRIYDGGMNGLVNEGHVVENDENLGNVTVVREVGSNATRAESFFFGKNDNIIRFSFIKDIDTAYRNNLEVEVDVCNLIFESIN